MLIKLVLIMLVVLAIIAIHTDQLRRVVIYLGIFSLASAFLYLLYSAPDVAIAEAVIGSTLSTILYLIALKKYKIFTVYYITDDDHTINDKYINRIRQTILKTIESYLTKKELESQVIYTHDSFSHIRNFHQYDIIIRLENETFMIYGNKENYQLDEIYKHIEENTQNDVLFIRETEEDDD